MIYFLLIHYDSDIRFVDILFQIIDIVYWGPLVSRPIIEYDLVRKIIQLVVI